jgi:hypothetical protein
LQPFKNKNPQGVSLATDGCRVMLCNHEQERTII